MTLPANLNTVVVTGTFLDEAGAAIAGTVTFTPSATLTDSAGRVIVGPGTQSYQLLGGALTSDAFAATDNAGLLPSGWSYTVRVTLLNQPPYSYSVDLPAAPYSFTATDAAPCVFTASGSSYADGAGVKLTGASLPAGFTAGTTYYVVDASGDTFSLAATSGGSAITSTSTGSGTVSTAVADLSALTPVASSVPANVYLPLTGGTVTGATTFEDGVTLGEPLSLADGGTGVSAGSDAALLADLGAVPLSDIGAASGVAGLDAAQRIITPVGASYDDSWPAGGGFALPAPGPVSRRPAYRAASWSQLFQSGHGWTAIGSGVASSNMNDTSTFIKGTQCATITTAGNGLQANFKSPEFSALNLTGQMIRLTFQIANVTNLNYITLYAGSSSFSNYFVFPVHTHSATAQNIVQSGEWVTLTIPWANVQTSSGSYSISSSGVPSTTTGFTDMELAIFDNGSGAVTAHLQAVEVIPDTVTTFPNGVISITFDDSYEDVFTYARPVMDTYGYRGTVYNIASAIGASGSLTVAQLQQMQDVSGWENAGHAYTLAAHNAGYDALTALEVEDEMRYLRAWMLSNGFPLDSFAYPMGIFSSTTDNVPIDQICSQYFATGRSIVSETAETFGPPMPYRLRSKTGISSAGTSVSTLTAAGAALDRCVNDGSWLVLTFHDIITGTPTENTQISQSDFSTLMAAIASRGIPVLPVGDVIRNYS